MPSAALVRAVCGEHQILCRGTGARRGEPDGVGLTLAHALAAASASRSARPFLACIEHLLGSPRLYEPVASLVEARHDAESLYEYHLDFRSQDGKDYFDNALPRVEVWSTRSSATPLVSGDYVRFRWWINHLLPRRHPARVPPTRLETDPAYAALRAREARAQLTEAPVAVREAYWRISPAGEIVPSGEARSGDLISLSMITDSGAALPVVDAVDAATATRFAAEVERVIGGAD